MYMYMVYTYMYMQQSCAQSHEIYCTYNVHVNIYIHMYMYTAYIVCVVLSHSQEPIPTVESFLHILLEEWNGDDYRREIMDLLSHLSLQSFDSQLFQS